MPTSHDEHQLLIEPLFRTPKKLLGKKQFSPTQNEPFSLGLRIKNLDSKVFTGATLKNFMIESMEQKTLHFTLDQDLSVGTLNPGVQTEIWWPNEMSTLISGIVWISGTVEPSDPAGKITTFQIDKNTKVTSKYKDINRWGDALYIQGKFELEQATTNYLIFVLTLLIFLEGVFGLKIIVNEILKFLQLLFLTLAQIIGSITK